MIIDNLNLLRTCRTLRPLKAYPPLIINPDTILTSAITFQRFKPIARKSCQIFKRRCCIKPIKPDFGLSCKARKGCNILAFGKARSSLIFIAQNHRRVQKNYV